MGTRVRREFGLNNATTHGVLSGIVDFVIYDLNQLAVYAT